MKINRRQALKVMGVLSLSGGVRAAEANFPSRPIRLVLPFSAGSSTDYVSRTIAEMLGQQLKQSVIVDNKPGAAGVIGTQQIARALPDGYTIGLVSLASIAMVPPTLKEAPYDPVQDFEPLGSLVSTDLILVRGASVPANSVPDFVAWGQRQDKPAFLGTLGAGTSGHIAGVMFSQAAKVRFETVHFRTYSDLLSAMIAGEVHAMVVAPSAVLVPHVHGGKLRALAMNGPSRLSTYPEVPTFKEVGYPDMQFLNWIGLVAPAGTPRPIVERLTAEIEKARGTPAARQKFEAAGFRVISGTREDFAATIRKDVATWKDRVRNAGIKV